MAPSLSSNSFLLTITPRSKLTFKNRNSTIILAQRSGPSFPFRLGGKQNQDGSSSTDENKAEESNKPGSFFLNLGKNISDGKSLVPVVKQFSSPGLSFVNLRRKDPRTVFVAGAAGQAGIRIAQNLLRQGFTVRAAVPDLGAAQELARLAATYKIISSEESKRLNAVGSTFQDPESIAKAIGNATKVVVTVGPQENGPTSGVTLSDAIQVIQASQLAGVDHVAIIYDGTSSTSTYNVLDGISSFFNNLFSRSQTLTVTEFLEQLVQTDVKYTLIKTKLTEDFKPESSYKVVVANEGSSGTTENNVCKSQIASLVADVFSNTAIAENKVVEVYTDPSAPLKSTYELFSVIPEDGRRKAYAEAIAKAKAEEEAIKASERAREAAEAAKKLEVEVKKLSEQEVQAASLAKEAQQKAVAAGNSVESLLNKAKKGIVGSGVSWGSLSSQIANAVQEKIDENKSKVQIATVRGEARARTLPAKKAVVKKSTPKPTNSIPKKETKPKAEPAGVGKETRNVFGGLFKQETIYIDDV